VPSQSCYSPSDERLRALIAAISPARFSTYERLSNFDNRRAVTLYLWNARIAEAFYFPLQTNEVLLRNAVAKALAQVYGSKWPFSPGFQKSLPDKLRGIFIAALTPLVSRIGQDSVTTGDVIAALTYGFWVALLTARHQTRIWTPHFRLSFPGAPAGIARDLVHKEADRLRDLRNRIAHHEPVIRRDLAGDYQRTINLISWVCPETASWVIEHSHVIGMIAQRPE
jgi:hypothetical protein